MTDDVNPEKIAALRRFFVPYETVGVAFSGGVDSTLVLKMAYDQLGARAVAITAVSASLPSGELDAAREIAAQLGARHIVLPTYETADARYLANPVNRCYFCKGEMYTQMQAAAERERLAAIVDGLNADDLRDRRPGRQAAREHGVQSPLAEVGMTKGEVRALSRALGLSNWDKPALACLSSRIPYGTTITLASLTQVDRAEMYVRALGIRQVRVRHLGDRARVEVEPDDLATVESQRAEITAYLNALGFAAVEFDLYRPGRLNDDLKTQEHPA